MLIEGQDQQPSLNGKHVVFGKVFDEKSMEVLRMVGNVKTNRGTDVPLMPVVVSQCGEM